MTRHSRLKKAASFGNQLSAAEHKCLSVLRPVPPCPIDFQLDAFSLMTSVTFYVVALSQGSFGQPAAQVWLFSHSAARKNLKQRLKLKPHFPSHFCLAISMGPIHQDRFSVDLLEYDDAKLSIHRRSIPEMRMDQMLRTHILQSSGHSLREIMQATIEAQDHRKLRRQSVQSSSTHLMLYRAKTNARRRLQCSFGSLKHRNFATSMQQRVSQTNTTDRNTNNSNSKINQPKSLGATTHMRPRGSLTL